MRTPLAIIGAGNMAEAIARAVLRAGVLDSSQIVAADVSAPRRELFERELSIRCFTTASEAVAGAGTVLLSVKPQQMQEILREIALRIADDILVISIAAGVTIAVIESALQAKESRIIRSMPNTPMLVGAGMVAMAAGSHATSQDLADARQLFEPAATVIEVTEDKLDAVTALSGSGPAYFFFMVEQMIQAGVEMGLTEDEAKILSIRTAIGSGKMLDSTDELPQELRRRVTSPGGTTEAAISHMRQEGFDRILVEAIKAAHRRGREIGDQLAHGAGSQS